MAFATKIEGVPFAGEEDWLMDGVSWWDHRELRSDPRFRELHVNDGYLDYVAILTREEAQELNSRFAREALDHQKEDAERLTRRLEKTRWAIVQIYEWESGL